MFNHLTMASLFLVLMVVFCGQIWIKRCSDAVNLQNDQFRDVATKVVKDVAAMAPGHTGYAEGRSKAYGLSFYGMAICWNTLDEESCSDCLSNASRAVLECLPSIEARSLSVGCYLRYSQYESKDGSNFVLNTKGQLYMSCLHLRIFSWDFNHL